MSSVSYSGAMRGLSDRISSFTIVMNPWSTGFNLMHAQAEGQSTRGVSSSGREAAQKDFDEFKERLLPILSSRLQRIPPELWPPVIDFLTELVYVWNDETSPRHHLDTLFAHYVVATLLRRLYGAEVRHSHEQSTDLTLHGKDGSSRRAEVKTSCARFPGNYPTSVMGGEVSGVRRLIRTHGSILAFCDIRSGRTPRVWLFDATACTLIPGKKVKIGLPENGGKCYEVPPVEGVLSLILRTISEIMADMDIPFDMERATRSLAEKWPMYI